MNTKIVASTKALILALGLAVASEAHSLTRGNLFDVQNLVNGHAGTLGAYFADNLSNGTCSEFASYGLRVRGWCFDINKETQYSNSSLKGIYKIKDIQAVGAQVSYLYFTKYQDMTACKKDTTLTGKCYDIR